MVDTIEKALYPFSLISFIFGFGILARPSNHMKRRLSILYMFIVWSVYACAFHYMVMFFTPRRIFNSAIKFFMIMTNLFVTIISIFITISKYKKLIICIRKLSFVDETLEEYGTPKEYRKIRDSFKWILVMWFITIGVTWIIDCIWYAEIYNDARAIFIPIILSHSVHINTFMDIMFALILRYIGFRLDKINEHIGNLSEIDECKLKCSWKKSLFVTRRYVHSKKNGRSVLWTTM